MLPFVWKVVFPDIELETLGKEEKKTGAFGTAYLWY